MSRHDGSTIFLDHEATCDFIVVGSGPAGASVTRTLSASGAEVAVIEEGDWIPAEKAPADAFTAMSRHYRDMGTSVILGKLPIPYIQGKAVGGGSVINGAICWPFPEDVHREWCLADPALAQALPWSELSSVVVDVERDLKVSPTPAGVAGRKNLLMSAGAEALGLAHRPIRRNVSGCTGRGRCLQVCPDGNKLSMDRAYLLDAERLNSRIYSGTRVRRILHRKGHAYGVTAMTKGGAVVKFKAKNAVILAASAVQTPLLLMRSGLGHGPVGENFQCHPGVAVSARFPEPVRMWEGATQGHEVIGLRREGLKFESLGFGLGIQASRQKGTGIKLAEGISDMAHWLQWGAAIRSDTKGRVRSLFGRPLVRYSPSTHDIALFRRGIRVLGEMMFAAGAEFVCPGVHGWDPVVRDPMSLQDLERSGPKKAKHYSAAVSHMFGTCRMGSDAGVNVVRPDFRHHKIDSLYVADSSVFPSNIGVNPMISIMAMATICGRRILAA
jgi:choline dehydrogenase-like flavoprotein